jgi:protein O-mannosyl-transferase
LKLRHLNTISTDALAATFSEPYGGQYSPVNTLAYMVIVRAGGMEPFGFQLFFLLLHLANFILVGLVLQKLLLMIPDVGLKDSNRFAIAWAVAFLFAIHPMQVEAVAWISASKVVLYGFFYLLGLWYYLLYRQTGKTLYFWIVFACFLASLLSKEQAVVFVLTLVLVDRAVLPKTVETYILPKTMWLEKVPFFIVAVLFGLATILISEHSGAGGEAYPLGQRILFANYSFWEYLVKLSAPYGLSHFYFFPMDPGEAIPLRFWFYPMATAFFIWVLAEYRDKMNRVLVFGGLFFLLNIVTAMHIIPVPREAIIADRYVYLSAIGFFLLVVFMIHQWGHQSKSITRKVVLAAGFLYLLVLAGYTHERVKVWENMDTLNENIHSLIELHAQDVILPGPCE